MTQGLSRDYAEICLMLKPTLWGSIIEDFLEALIFFHPIYSLS